MIQLGLHFQPLKFDKAALGGKEMIGLERERGDHRRIASDPVHEGPVVGGLAESHGLTGPLNRNATLRHQMGGDLPPFVGRYSFFAMTSFSAAFSRETSAYIRVSRLFSCSNSFTRSHPTPPARCTCPSTCTRWRS